MNKKFLVLLLATAQVETLIEAHSHHSNHGSGGHYGHYSGGRYGGRYGGRWGGRHAWLDFAAWGTFWLLATAPLWYTASEQNTQQNWESLSKSQRLDAGIQYLQQQLNQTPGDAKLQAQITELVVQKAKL